MAAFKVIITQQAGEDADAIIAFLQNIWSPELAIRFINAYYKSLDILESTPELGIKSQKLPGVRRKMIDRYNALYYEISGNDIYVLRIIDTRSNPENNPY